MGKSDLSKLKKKKKNNFCSAKDPVTRRKRQATDSKKRVAQHVSDNSCLEYIDKSKLNLKKKKTIQLKNVQKI